MKDNYNLAPLKKKKRKNSRTKGNNFEIKICGILNERFKTKEFCRTPGSGAFATTHTLPKHLNIGGDLITPKNFKFLIECKKGYNSALQISEFFNEKSWINGVLYKVLTESKLANKEPLLIIKQDRKPELVITNRYLKAYAPVPTIHIGLSDDWSWSILPLEDFLKFGDEFFTEQLS